jgi:hypothetical protein
MKQANRRLRFSITVTSSILPKYSSICRFFPSGRWGAQFLRM